MRVRNRQEKGAALIISLIILLAMTVIGVSTMKGALMEVKMAGTAQQEVLAGRQAERTLLTAEAAIEAMVATDAPFEFSGSDDGYYLPEDDVQVQRPEWSGIAAEDGPSDSGSAIGHFVIEYHGAKPVPGETVKVDTNQRIVGGAVFTFRNSARSSPRPGAVRIVQSLYTTTDAP